MMPVIKPEKHNGTTVGRAYAQDGGTMTKLSSSSAFHLPTIDVVYPHEPLGLIVDRAAQQIVGMRAMTTSELRQRLHQFALDVIANEQRKVK